MIKICSGITNGRVINGELYAQRLQKFIYLHLLTGCFMKISIQPSDWYCTSFVSIPMIGRGRKVYLYQHHICSHIILVLVLVLVLTIEEKSS